MQERISWTTYRGKRVLRIDYSKLRGEEFLPVIRQVPPFYKNEAKGSVLCLIDVREALATQEAVDGLKSLVSGTTREYDKKVAVLGIAGVKKAIFNLMNMFAQHSMKPFDSEQEALDWLVS